VARANKRTPIVWTLPAHRPDYRAEGRGLAPNLTLVDAKPREWKFKIKRKHRER
jgi:hypothetical protein